MQSMYQVINTTNRAAGFYGTMGPYAAGAWPLAMVAISKATGAAPRVVRFFLDSAHGERFGEDVLNARALGLQRAIDHVTEEWMNRAVDEQTAKTCGIRSGPSYLKSHLVASAVEVRLLGDLA
ncbi:hypothetical protein GO279_04451 [Ralstonia solanacearum]|uniref:hypothetical protein n=2 Tax=Ralstonia pseudosolanacearum TaxID=1310165 RepID=UPI001432F36A|nr:hypothetical protein [Ralstonia pseudosolanacearum]NKA55736.1 hypothetical protein [Ralstonia solanacearum]NKA69918.1 hypothetical protein [Ralstonia solanacearum]NKA85941.1 hypothetical protein [Ralstonia solanacearum]NKF57314.1 hypothetical protein [Ralstonia solanacearum]